MATPLPLASPAALGFDAGRLARIDRFLAERYVEPGLLPCALLLVARGGEVVHKSVLGHASLARRQRLAEDTIFRIYSMTKPVTSVAFMMLVEEGRIAIDDPVAKWIPSWRDLAVYRSGVPGAFTTRPLDAPMRVIDLLRHTSGLTYGFQLRTNVDAAYRSLKLDAFEAESLASFVDALGRIPLEFSPGTAWNYSVSTDVVGHLVSVVSGVPFDEFVRSRILQPLAMHDTDFHVPEAKVGRFADCYVRSASGALEAAPPQDYLRPPRAPSGGGGLVSTAADYLRFCEMLRRGGELEGVRLLGPKTLELMRANHLPGGRDLADLAPPGMFSEVAYQGVGFGLGFATVLDPARSGVASSPGEYSWGGMASTAFWVDPVEDVCVVLMTQLIPSSTYPIRRELRTMVNAAIVEAR
ncbi:MAG TPA: serine hydrolase domain-containing protein [Caldimonas sp.]|nr:serine hydrolase domain-containing protein [Caldimonas sp.]HEX4233771.1 serine hydrolase domain-containing protein [Caldimonas sp.]